MLRKILQHAHNWQRRFSFGSTSAIITNLALMAGLHSGPNAKVSIMGGILVIALADNISDSFGIHIFQECERIDRFEVWISTAFNFMSRVIVSLTFIALMLILPLNAAILSSIVWGLLLLAVLSYLIAKNEFERSVRVDIHAHLHRGHRDIIEQSCGRFSDKPLRQIRYDPA